MRSNALLLLVISLLATGCDNPTEPRPWSEFAGKELHQKHSCGWCARTGVAVYPDRTVHAFVFGATEGDTLIHRSRVLRPSERATITRSIEQLSTVQRFYPGQCTFDGSNWVTRLVDGGVAKWETDLCDESEDVPPPLWDLVYELERLRSEMLEDIL